MDLPSGFAAALRLRYLGDRPANDERTLTAQGWTLLDLLLRYRWRNVEASLSFLNVTATNWREAQFAEATCLRTDEGTMNPLCPAERHPAQYQSAADLGGHRRRELYTRQPVQYSRRVADLLLVLEESTWRRAPWQTGSIGAPSRR